MTAPFRSPGGPAAGGDARPAPPLARGCDRRRVTPPDRLTFDARDITGAAGLADLILDGQVYTLRITKQGKLLLTK